MATAGTRLLDEHVKDATASLVRIRAGRFPGTEILDLGSEDGFLGEHIAASAEDWTVHSLTAPDQAPGNLETVDASFPQLPFETGQLAGVVAAAVDAPLDVVSPQLLEELARVLTEDGRFVVAFRAPGAHAPEAERRIPENAVDLLEAAGFDPVTETYEQHLRDGSELRLLRAVAPASPDPS